MCRYLSVTVLLVLFKAGTVECEEQNSWAAIGQRASDSVVRVLSYGAEFSWMEPHKAPQPFSGSGTAFFIDAETLFGDCDQRYLLTNYHVISGAKALYVTLSRFGKKCFPVVVQGVCPEWDIALLKLTAESRECIEQAYGPVQPLLLGDSDELYPTQPVLAVGYPFGSGIKTTSGAVAGRDFWDQSLIHITAPINPGNSGGPLFTKEGKVVGINTAVRRNAQNYNYVIPSNDILTVLPDLHAKGLVRRHHRGMITNRATEAHALLLGNPLPSGAYVSYVFKDSAEYRAGMRPGDMLYELIINGKSFAIDEDGEASVPWRKGEKIALVELFARCRTTDSVVLVVYRKGKRLLLQSSFEESPYPIRRIHPDYEPNEIDFEIFGGLVCMQLRSNHIEWLHGAHAGDSLFLPIRNYVSEKQRNEQVLIVTHVFPGSQADFSRGFFVGSLLDSVNGEAVPTLHDLRKALAKSAQTQVITVATKDDHVTAFDLKKIIEDEYILSSHFKYAVTSGVKNLMSKN